VASAKFILERMIAAMNRGRDSILKAKEIELFAKPRPKKKRVLKKSPSPLRKNRNSKARKKASAKEAVIVLDHRLPLP
jgi:hypothetical protein